MSTAKYGNGEDIVIIIIIHMYTYLHVWTFIDLQIIHTTHEITNIINMIIVLRIVGIITLRSNGLSVTVSLPHNGSFIVSIATIH